MINEAIKLLEVQIWINKRSLVPCTEAFEEYIKQPTPITLTKVLKLGGYSKENINIILQKRYGNKEKNQKKYNI